MISIRAWIARLVVRALFRNVHPDADIDTLRGKWERMARRQRPLRGTRIEEETLSCIPCEWVLPPGVDADAPVLYYLHGGAYVLGSSRTHRQMVSHLAAQSGMRALVPNYRLAPEHPFPAGLDDCLAAYTALRRRVDPRRIAIGGDSAGGGMSMAVLMKIRELGERMPAAAVLFSPWLDLSGSGESMEARRRLDPLFRSEDMPRASLHYAPESQWRNPLVSPIFGDHRGLPPLLVQVGDHELLLSDSTRLADSVSRAGGRITLQVFPGLWHVFQYYVGRIPEADRALRDAAGFLRRTLDDERIAATGKAA